MSVDPVGTPLTRRVNGNHVVKVTTRRNSTVKKTMSDGTRPTRQSERTIQKHPVHRQNTRCCWKTFRGDVEWLLHPKNCGHGAEGSQLCWRPTEGVLRWGEWATLTRIGIHTAKCHWRQWHDAQRDHQDWHSRRRSGPTRVRGHLQEREKQGGGIADKKETEGGRLCRGTWRQRSRWLACQPILNRLAFMQEPFLRPKVPSLRIKACKNGIIDFGVLDYQIKEPYDRAWVSEIEKSWDSVGNNVRRMNLNCMLHRIVPIWSMHVHSNWPIVSYQIPFIVASDKGQGLIRLEPSF